VSLVQFRFFDINVNEILKINPPGADPGGLLRGDYACLHAGEPYALASHDTTRKHVINDINRIADIYSTIAVCIASLQGFGRFPRQWIFYLACHDGPDLTPPGENFSKD
jgi:hypothetical protein